MLFNITKYFNLMAFSSVVLYPAKINKGECHEARRQDIMIDGSSPKKFIAPSQSYHPVFKPTSTTICLGCQRSDILPKKNFNYCSFFKRLREKDILGGGQLPFFLSEKSIYRIFSIKIHRGPI